MTNFYLTQVFQHVPIPHSDDGRPACSNSLGQDDDSWRYTLFESVAWKRERKKRYSGI